MNPPLLPREPGPVRRFLRNLWAPANLLSVGWGLPALLATLGLTLLTYFLLNTWLFASVENTYTEAVLPGLPEMSSARAADHVLDFIDISDKQRPELRRWLKQELVLSRPAHKQIEDLFVSLSGAADATESAYGPLLHDLIVGRRRNWPVFWVVRDHAGPGQPSLQTVTGEDVVKAVEEFDGGTWRKALKHHEHYPAKRAVLVRFCDHFIKQMGDPWPVRVLSVVSGWVQWATIFLFWLIMVVIVRRLLALLRLGRDVRRLAPTQDWADMLCDERYRGKAWPAEAGWYRDSFGRLRTALENDVYGTFSFLLGLLPSFGFIGTVQGIGNALLAASGLFSQREKERTIGEITRHLGFAFDATFIALLLGAIAGAIAVMYRLHEQKCLRRWEARLVKDWTESQLKREPLRRIP